MKLTVMVDSVPKAEAGGASTAVKHMLKYLQGCVNISLVNEPSFRCKLLGKFDRLLSSDLFQDLTPSKLRLQTRYQKKVKAKNVEIVFYLNPTNNARFLTSSSFYTSIWDLGHFELSWMNEFKSNRWSQRKEHEFRGNLFRAKKIILDSKETADRVSAIYGISKDKLVVIPFVPKDEFLSYSFRSNKVISREQYAIYPANFWEHKNHSSLLKAMKLILDSGQEPIKLVLTGEDMGYKKSVESKVKDYGLHKYVVFEDFVSLDSLIKLYLDAKLTVYPSLLGPTNIPPLESISLGIPVFASVESMSSIKTLNVKGIKLLPAKDIRQWSKVLSKEFAPRKVDAIWNRKRLSKVNQDNQLKIQSLMKEEFESIYL